MPAQAYHDITCSRARHPAVLQTIHAWLNENQFKGEKSDSELMVVAMKGTHFSIKGDTRMRKILILVRPEFGLTLVSICHSTPRFGWIPSLTDSDILQRESESLIRTIDKIPRNE